MGKYYAESDEDMPCKPLVNCLPVIFLLLIFGWAYYAYVVAFCVYLIEPVEKKAIYLTLFHVLFIMACITYFAAMCIENERVPGYYRLPIVEYELLKTANTEDAKNRLLEDFCKVRNISVYTVTNTGGVRYEYTKYLLNLHRALTSELFKGSARNANTSSLTEHIIVHLVKLAY